MNTTLLVEKSQGMIQVKPEVNDITGRYHMFDDGGTEVEVSEFLWGLIKLLQPEKILETGTYTGISSLYMAQALKENGHGNLVTLEIDKTHKDRAEKLWRNCEVINQVSCELVESLKYQPQGQYDFLFLDSEPGLRWQELIRFYPYLKEGGFVFIHDLPRGFCKGNVNLDHPEFVDWPWGPVPEEVLQLFRENKLVKWHFPNPREMLGLYKPRKDDYV